jgi:hypothetical protein
MSLQFYSNDSGAARDINKMKKEPLRQLQHESDTWKRTLAFMRQENNFLKDRLSQVLGNDLGPGFVERAEYFQNKFISEDETMNMMRQDLHAFDQLLDREIVEDGLLLKEIIKKQKHLKKDMFQMEQQFSLLQADFNSYLTSIV